MINNYLIADLNLCIDAEYDRILSEMLSPYFTENTDSDIIFRIKKTKVPIIIPKDAKLSKLSALKYFCHYDGFDTLYFYDGGIKKTVASIKFSFDYSDVEIISYDFTQDYDIFGDFVLYNLVGIAVGYLIQMHEGFVFHSSAISCHNFGLVFSAKSGTGKSTHTSLWLDQYKDAVIVNDDSPIIRIQDDCVLLYGTPWAGTSGINTNKAVPLKAIVFLSRGETNLIKKLNSSDAVKPFFDGILSPLNPRMLSNAAATMDKILNSVSAYTLSCNMNPDAAVTVHNFIFGEGDLLK